MSKEFWDRIQKNPWAEGKVPEHWPEGVKSLSIDGFSLIGVDSYKRDKIYFNGKPIAFETRFATPERIIGWVVAISSVVAALGTCIQAYFSWK